MPIYLCYKGAMKRYSENFSLTQVYQNKYLINNDIFVTGGGIAKPFIIRTTILKMPFRVCDTRGGIFL